MTGFFRFCRELPEEMLLPFQPDLAEEFGSPGVMWQTARAGDMLPHIYWLYNHTGDAWLLDLATRFFQHIARALPRSTNCILPTWLDKGLLLRWLHLGDLP